MQDTSPRWLESLLKILALTYLEFLEPALAVVSAKKM
jgi:hypothetical protein